MNDLNSLDLKNQNNNNSIDHLASSLDLTDKSNREVPHEGFNLGTQCSLKLI